jgi:hypothetical protein
VGWGDRTAQENDGRAIAFAKGRLKWGDRRLRRCDRRSNQRQSSSPSCLRINRSPSKNKRDRTAQANDGRAIALAKGRRMWGDRRLEESDRSPNQRQS